MKTVERKAKNLNPQTDRLAGRVAEGIIGKQRRFAGYLERKTRYWNRASKLTALILLCILFGGPSLYLLLQALF